MNGIAHLGNGEVIENSVIGENSRINGKLFNAVVADNSKIEDSIIRNCSIWPNKTISNKTISHDLR